MKPEEVAMTEHQPPPTRLPAHIPLVESTRGPIVESIHFGSFAVVDPSGAVTAHGGDPHGLVYARSALKPLQTVAMLRAGLDLPPDLLALSAASHSGSPEHQDGARRILALHGIDESALQNTRDLPVGVDERAVYLRAGGEPSRLTQNCSGKHAAMVATCVVNGWPTDHYLDPAHPLQELIDLTLAESTSERAGARTTDGCGTPLPAFSLAATARAYARLATAAPGTPEARVVDAMRAHPEMVAGHGRDVTALMRAVPGAVAKEGAEAVQLIGLRDLRVGIAVKIADGSDRARLPITVALLAALGIDDAHLSELSSAPVRGGSRVVGGLRAASLAFGGG
jgi:L-asparaginase II